MATAEPSGHAERGSAPGSGPRLGTTPGRSAGRAVPAAVEKRGPYLVARVSSVQAQLQKHRDLARAVLRRKGMLGASPKRPESPGKRSVKFNKGYTALSQSPDENLVSLDSDSDGELESTYSSGYSSAEQVNQDVSRQLLQDGYHLDEMPDDEDLDLIPPSYGFVHVLLLLVLSWGFTLLYPPVDRTPELGPVDFVGLGVLEHCPGHWLRCSSGKVNDLSHTLSSVSQA